MWRFQLAFVAILSLVMPVHAQPLADRVPEDSIIYLGWCGSSEMPSEFNGSHLKAVLDSSNLPAVFNDFVPRLIARAAIQDPRAGEVISSVSGLLGAMWRHPTAIYFTGVDLNAREPIPHVGITCKAGDDLQSMVERLNSLKRMAENDFPLNWVTDKDQITVFIGAQPDAVGKGLGNTETFKKALTNVQPGAALVFYMDGQRLTTLIGQAIEKSGEAQVIAYWPKVLAASGLSGLGRVIWTSGFDGKDWMDRMFVEAPAPRKGLLAWCDAPPVPDELLKCVPSTATYMSAGGCDLAACIESIRTIVGEVDKRGLAHVDQGIGMASMVLGKNLQKDVLEPLGTHWVMYVDPNTAGLGMLGIVLVNKLDDPKKAEQGLNSIATLVSNMSAAAMREQQMSIPTRQTTVGDLKVTYLAAPVISPSWVIKDDKLFIALYPQVAAAAARNVAAGKQSILENPDYIALRKRLGGPNAVAVEFADLRRTALEGYQSMLLLSRLAMGFADMWGVKSPELVVPTLEDLQKHLAPMGSISWTDDAGLHMLSVCPFPGSEAMSGSAGGLIAPLIGTSALGSAVLLPSLGRARETARRVQCASNMRQIGQGMLLYANEHKGQYPQSLGDLMQEDLTLDVFLCPTHADKIPAEIRGADPTMQAGWVNSATDYVYLGAGKTTKSPVNLVLLYEKAEDHSHQGMNLLYGDGHVEWAPMGRAMQEIQRATGNRPK